MGNKMQKEFIAWQCVDCEAINTEYNHSDPYAHLVSMVCEVCGTEYDGCFCENAISANDVIAFFEQVGINKSGVCKEVGIARQYLNRMLSAKDITITSLGRLMPTMIKYGFKPVSLGDDEKNNHISSI